jgi:hypothetical protein
MSGIDCRASFIVTNEILLANQAALAHNRIMTYTAGFTTDVVKDIGNPNRFRWNIYDSEKVRDKSFYSFATKREAQADADKFVQKLNAIWPAAKE